MRLADLNPRFMNSGGADILQKSDRLCATCNGENAGACEACHGSGFEYVPAPLRTGVGVVFRCPCGNRDESHECYVPFMNPLDGGPSIERGWQRVGDTFDTLTLTPSILRSRARGGCGWHGFIVNGDVTGRVEP